MAVHSLAHSEIMINGEGVWAMCFLVGTMPHGLRWRRSPKAGGAAPYACLWRWAFWLAAFLAIGLVASSVRVSDVVIAALSVSLMVASVWQLKRRPCGGEQLPPHD